MHVYYKFGLLLIFILSVSTCYTRAAPATNQSTSYYDDYTDDDYDDDYYDDRNETADKKHFNKSDNLIPTTTKTIIKTITTELNRLIPKSKSIELKDTSYETIYNDIEVPKRSNHVIEPSCPKSCLCLEDYKFVQCSNARLTNIPKDLPSTALIIDLSHNNIKEIKWEDFANCTRVREINLSFNQLNEIPKETFAGLRRLKRLRFNNNYLTEIDADTFSGSPDLDALDFSNNSIILNDDTSFLNQPKLLDFACQNCSWTQIYDETFLNMSSLTSLKLDRNDFNKKINTKAFTPLKNLIKLKLPELEQKSIQELCSVLKAIDNISFKHFDISCYELVLGTSFNESLILATDPPYNPNVALLNITTPKTINNSHDNNIIEMSETINDTVFHAGMDKSSTKEYNNDDNKVDVSPQTIEIMLIGIMVIAALGIIIGVICRKDVGGIKTKCCRTKKNEQKEQTNHPTEEIPLRKLG